jgi:alpha-ketoglutarate-dependent taurine dioxygenase
MARQTLDVSPIRVAGQQTAYGKEFPRVLECQTPGAALDDAAAWVSENRDALKAQVTEHGAILFRGFPVRTPEDFDALVSALDLPNFPYNKSLSNAVRVNWTERVFSANEAPPTVTIYLHHEMAQTPMFPAQIFFFCQTAAEEGGETPICRSDVLYERLAAKCPEFIRNCEENGLQYTNVMPGENDAQSGMGRSWQSTLGTTTQEGAEARLAELGYSWKWLDDGCLQATTPVLPAVRELPNGRKAFFNQLIAAFQGWKDVRNDPAKAIRFGDGTPLDQNATTAAAQLAEELTFDVPWQSGDVVFMDNCVAMHGRRTFRGTRKVLASLASAQRQSFVARNGAAIGPHAARAGAQQTAAS